MYKHLLKCDTGDGVGSIPTYVNFWLRRSFRHGTLTEPWNCLQGGIGLGLQYRHVPGRTKKNRRNHLGENNILAKVHMAPYECKFRFRLYTMLNLNLPEHVKGNEPHFCISLGNASLPVRLRSMWRDLRDEKQISTLCRQSMNNEMPRTYLISEKDVAALKWEQLHWKTVLPLASSR